jgi:hypothetical protein
MLLAALAAAALTGCQGSTDSNQASSSGSQAQTEQAGAPAPQGAAADRQLPTPPADTSSPAAATAVFLDALRRGDDEMILQMYTQRARQQASELEHHFAPRGSDTARYTVGQAAIVGQGVSHVACTWTDLDQDGDFHTLEFVWALRQEQVGWRVAGMVVTPFPGEPPVLLDFENLAETMRKVDQLAEEIHRRNAAGIQAQQAKKSETPVLR